MHEFYFNVQYGVKKMWNEKSSFSCRSIYVVWYNVHNYMENEDIIYVSLQIIDNFTG